MGRPQVSLKRIPNRSYWGFHVAALRRSHGGKGKILERKLEKTRESIVSLKKCTLFQNIKEDCTKAVLEFYNFLFTENGLEGFEVDAKFSRVCSETNSIKLDSEENKEERIEVLSKSTGKLKKICKVCYTFGASLSCNSCNSSFHLRCTRPIIYSHPDSDWRCSFCTQDKESIRSMKRISRKSRQKVAGLSESGKDLEFIKEFYEKPLTAYIPLKLYEKFQSHRKEKSNDLAELITEKEPVTTLNEIDSIPKTKKRSYPDDLDDALSPDFPLDAPRARRVRKQPTLYDPQTCSASEWQSDFQLEQALKEDENPLECKSSTSCITSDSADDESEDVIVSDTDMTENLKPQSLKDLTNDAIWCDFCKDDKSISICCFCACRVCFSKHDERKLLLCDSCDAEYHIYCLTPTLTEIPKDKWFCPVCVENRNQSNEKSSPSLVCEKVEEQTNTNILDSSLHKKRQKKQKISNFVLRVVTKILPEEQVAKTSDLPHYTPMLESKQSEANHQSHHVDISREMTSNVSTAKDTTSTVKLATVHSGNPRPRQSSDPTLTVTPSPIIAASKTKNEVTEVHAKPSNEIGLKSNSVERSQNILDQMKSSDQNSKETLKIDKKRSNDDLTVTTEGTDIKYGPKLLPLKRTCDESTKKTSVKIAKNLSSVEINPCGLLENKVVSAAEVHPSIPSKNESKVLEFETNPTSKHGLKSDFDSKDVTDCVSSNATMTNSSSMEDLPANLNVSKIKDFKTIAGNIPISGSSCTAITGEKDIKNFVSKASLKVLPTSKACISNSEVRKEMPEVLVEPTHSLSPVVSMEVVKQASEEIFPEKVESLKTQKKIQVMTEEQNVCAKTLQTGKDLLSKSEVIQSNPTLKESLTSTKAGVANSSEENLKENISAVKLPSKVLSTCFESTKSVMSQGKSPDSNPKAGLAAMRQSFALMSHSVNVSVSNSTNTTLTEALKKAPLPVTSMTDVTSNSTPAKVTSSVDQQPAASPPAKVPRRKPGARECMQISRRFGANVISQKYMDILLDYCTRGKVEHLIRMRERLDEHSRFLESQLAGLETLVKVKGNLNNSGSTENTAQK